MTLNLKAQKKDPKLSNKQLRKAGFVPCSLYGKDVESTSFQIPHQSLSKFFKSGNKKVHIDLNGQKYFASVEEAQKAPAHGHLLHVSFHAFKPSENISMDIPVRLVGKAKGQTEGGILQQQMQTICVYGPAQDLPEHFDVDVEKLEVGASLHVSDLKPSAKFEIKESPDKVLVACNYPRVQEPEVESEPEKVIEAQEQSDHEQPQIDKEAA